jgi:hypothetical protein
MKVDLQEAKAKIEQQLQALEKQRTVLTGQLEKIEEVQRILSGVDDLEGSDAPEKTAGKSAWM